MSTNVMNRILQWRESSWLLLLQDTSSQWMDQQQQVSALRLLQPLLQPVDKKEVVVHYACIDTDPRRELTRLSYVKELHIYDVHSCIFGLPKTSDGRIHDVADLDDLRTQVVNSHNQGLSHRSVLVLDSITTLFLLHPMSELASFLSSFKALGDSFRMVVIHHTDIPFPNLMLSPNLMLADLSSTILNVLPEHDTSMELQVERRKGGGVVWGRVDIIHAKKSNKGVQETRIFTVEADGRIIFHDVAVRHEKETRKGETMVERTSAPSVDPTAGLSFELKLTDEQRQARVEVVLPYMEAQGPSQATHVITGFDEDEDEDDPDFDLEI